MLVERFNKNPLITPADVSASRDDFEVVGAFNAGAIKFKDEILLLLRVAERPKDKKNNEGHSQTKYGRIYPIRS